MAFIIVNLSNPETITPKREYLEEDRLRVTLRTGEVGGKEIYLTFPWSVETLDQEVVMTSLEAVQTGRGKRFRFWKIGWVQPWRRKEVDHVDLLLTMERDDVKFSFSRRNGRGYAHVGYHVHDSETMTFGLRIDPGTTVKVESLTGGATLYFAVDRGDDGRLTFSRPTAEEAEVLGIKWCQDLPVFRRAKK